MSERVHTLGHLLGGQPAIEVLSVDGGERGPLLQFVASSRIAAVSHEAQYREVAALYDALGAWLLDNLMAAKRGGFYR